MTATKNYQYKYPNESFSGCDMTATIVYPWLTDEQNYNIMGRSDPGFDPDDNINNNPSAPGYIPKRTWNSNVLGEIQTMSYSIHMEKRPVRSIGNVNAKDYVMGPRTIAGSLVFAVFNRHFATDIIAAHNNYFRSGTAFIVDELPPFNIVISMANEYGLRSKLVVYGVRLVNEGQVMSVNDVFTENTYQFVATDIEYLNAEMKYSSRKKNDYWINIKDTVKSKNYNLSKSMNEDLTIQHHDPDKVDIEKISMLISKKDALKNKEGNVSISLFPTQKEGTIKISHAAGDSDKIYTIHVNGKNSYSINLAPDLYTAQFSKPNPQKWICAPKNFLIEELKDKNSLDKYRPVIDSITDTSIKIYSNEYSHTSVSIKEENGTKETYYKMKNRRAYIENLTPNTSYKIYTFKDNDKSPSIIVKTYDRFEKPFNEFKKMVETNMNLLLYNEPKRYFDIIDEASKIAINDAKYDTPIAYITALKVFYENELKTLSDSDEDYYKKYEEIKSKINASSELILLSSKVHNNTMLIINKDIEIPAPTMMRDESYNAIFSFSDKVEKGEFFRVVRGMAQSSEIVYLDKIKNSNKYIYKGKSGFSHFVQSMIGKARSAKLEFYEMTLQEKNNKINNANNSISKDNIKKLQAIVTEDLSIDSSSETKERAFMARAKKIDNPILLPPYVSKVDKNYIEIITDINKFALNSPNEYYLCIANINDIINNDFIYKKKFTSADTVLILEDLYYALFNGVNYSIWIEDNKFEQLSNVTTFKMNDASSNENLESIEYELKNILSLILNSLRKLVPSTIYSSLCSEIEFNSEINSSNIVDKTLEFILSSSMNNKTIKSSIKAINSIIGPMTKVNNRVMNPSYKNHILKYDSDNTSNSLIIYVKDGVIRYQLEKDSKIINTKTIDSDYILIIGIDDNFLYKTDTIFINKNKNEMEVL